MHFSHICYFFVYNAFSSVVACVKYSPLVRNDLIGQSVYDSLITTNLIGHELYNLVLIGC